MSHQVKQTILLDASAPADVTKNRIALFASTVESNESKSVSVDVRGNVETSWTEFGEGTQRISKSAIPTSAVVAQSVSVDGFITSQTDHHGITTLVSREFRATGMSITNTDGRGNRTTTVTDKADRTVSVTDALGKTACYRYDIRGRKVAEFGTAIQPALFGYDDADRMTSLTTFRADAGDIVTAPSERTDALFTDKTVMFMVEQSICLAFSFIPCPLDPSSHFPAVEPHKRYSEADTRSVFLPIFYHTLYAIDIFIFKQIYTQRKGNAERSMSGVAEYSFVVFEIIH